MTTDEEIRTVEDVDKAKAESDIIARIERLEAEQKKNLETIAKLQEANKGLFARLTAEPQVADTSKKEAPAPTIDGKDACDSFLANL